MIGKVISGRYKIIKNLGSGGFGQTFFAEDLQLPDHHQCVVKQLKPASSDTFVVQTASRLFETEARVLHRLGNHDRIPRLLAHFEEEQEFYLVQELIEGAELTNELKPIGRSEDGYPVGRMNQAQAIAFLLDVLEILTFVHQQGAIHRDLKPANLIRRGNDGKLVLIDFGAVKQVGTAIVSNSISTVAIGTDGYMPNEQAIGKPRPCSDLYAVGAIAIQGLTGVAPNQLSEDIQTGELAWRQSPTHAAIKYRTNVSDAFAKIIDKLVRYDFRDRYQSAEEVVADLRELVRELDLHVEIAPTLVTTNAQTNSQEVTIVSNPIGEIAPTLVIESNVIESNLTSPQNALQPKPEKWLWIGTSVIVAIAVISAFLFLRPSPAFKNDLNVGTNSSTSADSATPKCDYNKRLISDPTPPINVRKGAGRDYAIVGTLENDVQIVVEGEKQGWLKISAPIAGWVAANRTKPLCL